MVKPSRSAYVPLAQSTGEEDEDIDELASGSDSPREVPAADESATASTSSPTDANSTTKRLRKLSSQPSATALHVDELFNKWTKTIAKKIQVKRKKRSNVAGNVVADRDRDVKVEIMASVFEVWCKEADDEVNGGGKGKGKEVWLEQEDKTLDHQEPMSREVFDELVHQVKLAIEAGTQPRLNSKGSSGSYFARSVSGSTLGIFKPKDEEPYGRLNPKLTKWIHRNFLSKIIPFGRACLIPQLSYLSEAAASLLDRRLEAHIVPRTECVDISSPAFFYDWIDRERAKAEEKGRGKGRKLPEKPGSFQVFLQGYQDASLFLRNHPYPGRPLAQTLDQSTKRKGRINILAPFNFLCGRAEAEGEDDEDDQVGWGWGTEDGGAEARERRREKEVAFRWTDDMMQSFSEELEKLVVLDYLMRNTDRGLDNFMIKACVCAKPAPTRTPVTEALGPHEPMSTTPAPSSEVSAEERSHIHLAAIDNSLSFPHQHPVGWRSYTYGWLYLPVSVIGLPFSSSTRNHYLPLLTSPIWWAQTTLELRQLFCLDPDFQEKMFRKQMAVMKGQAWNLVQSLKNPEDGPLELCRRGKKLVWDDFMEVADDDVTSSLIFAAANPAPPAPHPHPHSSLPASPIHSFASLPTPPHSPPTRPPRSHSDFDISSSQSSLPSNINAHRFPNGSTARRMSFSSVKSSPSTKERARERFGSLTGEQMIRRMDLVEKDAKTHGNDMIQESYDEEYANEASGKSIEWGVRSENDAGRGVGWKDRARQTMSFDIERRDSGSHEAERKNRSGSVSQPLRGKAPLLRNGSARNGHGQYASAEEDEANRGAWLREYSGTREASEDLERGEVKKKVVVVERMESVHETPVFSWC